jgi:amino acid adenylation domain-containing protein
MLTESQRATLVARALRGRQNKVSEIPRRPADTTDLPLSYGQEQLWFVDSFAPGEPAYNIPQALRLSGPLDAAALGRAIDALTARHEALRTRLVANAEGFAVQVIDQPSSVLLEALDLSGLEPPRRQARLREILEARALLPFSLAGGPLLRACLIRLGPAEHVLEVVVHHTVFDGWSAGVFLRELAALYGQEASNEPSGLEDLPVQFADYALWERDQLQGAALHELEDYWRNVMDGFETVYFPTDRPRPVLDNFDGGLVQHTTASGLLDDLRELSRREGTTPFVTLLTAVHALLHRYTGQSDLVVGTVSANRSRPELTPLIGFLVNTLPVRADVSGDPAFTELLARVKQAAVGAFAHQDLPFGRLVETLQVERDPSRAPVFQIALVYGERDSTPVSAAGVEFTITDLIVGVNAAKFDLTLLAEARDEGLWFECSYKTRLFDAATIRRFLRHLEVLLRGAVADPGTRVSELPVLTQEELRRELAEWNDTAQPVRQVCVHERFEEQAARSPSAIAAVFEDRQVPYAELNRWANQIARRLRELGVGPEVLVGVCMSTSLRRLAALLGIWKAGGGYVPLDPAAPAGRLEFMAADTGMPVVLTDGPSGERLPRLAGVTVVSLDAEWQQIGALDAGDLPGTGVAPANVAYVIYTSGSTGQPKGVMVEHRHAVNFLDGMVSHWQIGPGSAVLGFASFTFDVSVMDMFMPLLGGAKLVLAPAQTLHSPPRLAALIREARITFACLPPAVLSLLGEEDFEDLDVLMAAGEELPGELARRWLRPGLRLVNGYGPTEATVIATYAELGAPENPPPIGLPTRPNYRVYVLDAHLNPVPVGVAGELHIGGASVARGYLNRPELTRERFIPDPFSTEPDARLYKTGDLVRRRPDGNIVFLGRIDNQVKLRGLRIELGEVETALAAHPAVAQAVATVTTGQSGDKHLTAYTRPHAGSAGVSSGELRDHLARVLPAYMIPAYLVTVDSFPLNSSGKVDRSALPAPDRVPASTSLVPPATLAEAMVADLYARLLGHEEVSVTASFFDLGGNSLAAMRLINMIDNELEVEIDVATVFVAQTARQLAALLRDKYGLEDDELGAGGLDGLDDLEHLVDRTE